jgi:hypothetical protein
MRPFILAAALLTIPNARINDRGNRLPLIGKFWTARAVCGPYSAEAGICMSPIVSRSIRKESIMILL